jgi:type 1 glutamine amidotransferase
MRFILSTLFTILVAGNLVADAPKKLLLVGQGPDGHPPTTHEYMDGLKELEKILKPTKGIEITVVKADGKWENGPELIDRTDAIVFFVSEGAKWLGQDEKRLAAVQRAAKRKAGLSCLHWAMGCKDAEYIDKYVALFGGCHGGPDRKYQVLETDVKPIEKSPVTVGISPFKVKEEFYYRLKFVKPEGSVKPAVTAKIDGEDFPVCWTWDRPDGGRSFGFSGMHFHENWKRAEYRRLVGQGVLWTLGMPIPEKGLEVGD